MAGAQEARAAGSQVEILDYTLAANQDDPELCFRLSQTIMRQPDKPLETFVSAEPAAKLAVRPRNNHICVTGLSFGVTYTVTLKAGLPGVSGTLAKDVQYRVQAPNRPPEVSFVSPAADVLPRLGNDGLPIRSVNTPAVEVEVFRIADRDLLKYLGAISSGDADAAPASAMMEPVWRGEIDPRGENNRDVVNFLPVDKTLGALKPGAYVAAAWPAAFPATPGKDKVSTQVFMVSDLGLTAYRGAGSLLAGIRSLSTAAAVPDVDVALVAADNRELARARTDENGLARFDGNPVDGVDDERPAAIYAYGAGGEFTALSLAGPAAAPSGAPYGRLALSTDRIRYRAGDAVSVLAWVRNQPTPQKATLTVSLYRPNGALFDTRVLEDRGAGGYRAEFTLPRFNESGSWRLTATSRTSPLLAGEAGFEVSGADPSAMNIAIDADAAVLDAAQPGAVTISAQYATGQPAANAPGEARVTIEPAQNPFPAFPGFQFGLTDETVAAIRLDPKRFVTDAVGKARVPLSFGPIPNVTRPLDARIDARALDARGRSVDERTDAPIASQNLFFGIKAGSFGDFPEGQPAHFDIVALSRDGARQDMPGAGWEIVRRDFTPSWYWDGDRFAYRPSVKDVHVAGGNIDVAATSPAALDVNLLAGRYRLEVFDKTGEAISSLNFLVGWAPSAADVAADSVAITPAKPFYVPGEGEDVFVKPPYESDVTLVVSDKQVRAVAVQHVPAGGANLHIDAPRDASTGLSLLASAVAPPSTAAKSLPRRAIGAFDLPADPASRDLAVKLELPEKAVPGQTLKLPVTVTGAGDDPAFIEIVANVGPASRRRDGEEDAARPDGPADTLVETATPPAPRILDVYGRIITPSGLSGGLAADDDETARHLPGRPDRSDGRAVSLSSDITPLDKNGKATISMALPDFTGALSIQAIAWTASKQGHAEGNLRVHDPLSAELALPPTLAPDDRADLTLSLRNMDGPRGEYRVKLQADGAIATLGDAEIVLNLAEHEQRFLPISIVGHAPGPGGITLAMSGPNGIAFERHLRTGVRLGAPPVTRHAMVTLKPGASLVIEPSLTAGLRPDTVTASLAESPVGAFDLPGLATDLGEETYQTAERLVDQATPAAVTADAPPGFVKRLFDMQGADGGFSLWGSGPSDPWLSAYVDDFLTTVKNAGATLPEAPFALAIDYLARLAPLRPAPMSAAVPSPAVLESTAYAAKVLAMNKRLDLPRLRYFADRVGAQIHTMVTEGLLAAAFAELNDKDTAAGLFAQAAGMQGSGIAPDGFGSDLRDIAMLTALMSERDAVAQPAVLAAFARTVAAGTRRQFSPQEAAWIVRAQAKTASDLHVVTIEPRPVGTLPTVKNGADAPMRVALTVSGAPNQADTRETSGFEAQKTFFDTIGKPVDPMAMKQNDLVIVVVSGRCAGQGDCQPVVTDVLPAGWQMDGASIVDPGMRYPWLKDLSATSVAYCQDGEFVAAPIPSGERREFKVAYVIRAATRGLFALPGPMIDDLTQPGLSTRGAAGKTKIDAPAL